MINKRHTKNPEFNYEKEYNLDYTFYKALKNYLNSPDRDNKDWKVIAPNLLEQVRTGEEKPEVQTFATLEIKLMGNNRENPNDYIVKLRGRTTNG